MPDGKYSRREFLKKSTAGLGAAGLGAAAFSIPFIVSPSALGMGGQKAPSDRITIGCIGVGGMGGWHAVGYGDGVTGLVARGDVQVVAVCDVDTGRREEIRGMVGRIYADKHKGTGCDAYNDFRDLVARDDIDSVLIATPDHWHVLIAIAAVKSGKDVYCEKPMSQTVEQGQAMVRAVRRYGRVFQTGSQQRSGRDFRHACELVRNGRIGKLQTIEVGCYDGGGQTLTADHPPMAVPKGLDYDMWLGPAPWAPYTKGRLNFRGNFDYSGGSVTDWGAHNLDIAQWGNGTDDSGPVEVEGHGTFPTEGILNTAIEYDFTCKYANGVVLRCANKYPPGIKFIGTEGWTFVNRGAVDAYPKALLKETFGPGEVHLYKSDNHMDNYFDCIRTRRDPAAPVEVGHRTATMCHLGNIAMLLGRKLIWDPASEKFVGDDDANKMLSRPMRAPWHL